MNWKEFEKSSAEYLSNIKVFEGIAEFTHIGSSDSTTSDILVQTNKSRFFIEVKKSKAQCGQFVLFPNEQTKKFEFSTKNKTPLNKASQTIIDYMNANYEKFEKAGTKGVDITFDNCNKVFEQWILEAAKQKNVLFYMTKGYTILPVNDISKYFEITAKYRIKKSGSSNAGKQNIETLTNVIKAMDNDWQNIEAKGPKLFVQTSDDIDKKSFQFNGKMYMFAKRKDKYEVRKLSDTRNANVIFSIKYNGKKGLPKEVFAKFLKDK